MDQNTDITQILTNVEDCLLINGYFDDSLTDPIINYVTESQIDNKKSGRKLSFLIVESFQNIVRHGYDKCEENKKAKLKEGFFAMLKTGPEIIICTTNSIKNEKVDKLENAIKRLSGLDKESLKTEYIDVLSSSEYTDGGGAGLGLIEIMRKTNSQFDHWFSKKDVGISYIHFNIFFNENTKENIKVHKMDTVTLREIGIESNILFLRKGLFNHDTFLQLSAVLENKASSEAQEYSSALYYIFIELIQNIYKHGLSNENGEVPGLFYVQEYDDYFYFSSQNISSIENALIAKKRIDNLNALSSKELLDLYKQRLTQQLDFSENISGDIGLIEIIKASKNPLTCKITDVTNDSCVLTISVKLNI